MHARRFRIAVFALLLCLVLTPNVVFAQGTDLGTIRGTVSDSAGAVIPGATVVITDLTTGAARTVVSNASGAYELFGLKSGTYKVRVTAKGFTPRDIGVTVNTSGAATADAVLSVAGRAEVVEVTSEAAQINTEDQTISQTLTNESVIRLPRGSRDIYNFVYLNPNISQSTDVGSLKFIGAQSYGANFTLDGQRSNGGIWGDRTQSQPTLEAVGDINILSNDFSAEYAGISNIRVTTKRGGSSYHGTMFWDNENSALAAWTRQDLAGKANFAPTAFQSRYPNPYFNRNVFGGSVGGPIPHLKETWFFAAYEKNYNVSPVNLYASNLPHPSLLAGDFSLINDSVKPTVPADILAQMTPAELANNTLMYCCDDSENLVPKFTKIPQRLLNPDVQKLIGLYFPQIGMSAPINPGNGRVRNYYTQTSGRSVSDTGTLRIDHNFTPKDSIFVVYNTASAHNASNWVQSPYVGLGLQQQDRRNHTVSVSYTRTFSNSLINEVRGGFNNQNLYFHSNTTLSSFLSSIGFTGDQIASYGSVVGTKELSTHGHMAINYGSSFAIFNNGARNTERPADQTLLTFGDTLSWTHGKHFFRFGADTVRNRANDGFAENRNNVRGLLTYGGSNTDPLAKLLLGEPASTASYVQTPRPRMDVHNWELGYFVQDDWRVSPNFTLNLGFRYEIATPFQDKSGVMINFDPNYKNQSTGQEGRFIVPSQNALNYVPPFVSQYGAVVASKSGLGVTPGLIGQAWDRLAPRVGFAWRIAKNTSFRGGWGLYYPTSAAQGIRDPLATNTFNQNLRAQSAAGTSLAAWPTPTSGPLTPINGGVIPNWMVVNQPSVSSIDVNLKDPRIHQYNISIEHELGKNVIRASYIGSYMQRLIAREELEYLPPSNTGVGTTADGDGVTPCDQIEAWNCAYSPAELARMRFPGIPDGVPIWVNQGHGRSDAFQTEFRRSSKNAMFSFSYTYLDQKSTPPDSGNSSLGSVDYNFMKPGSDYGEDSFVSHQRFVAFGTYDLPFGRGRAFGSGMPRWANSILGGWNSSFSMFVKSGTYFTPWWQCDNCDPIGPGNMATSDFDAVGNYGWESYRPMVISKDYNKGNGDTIWNAAAFDLMPLGADVLSNPNLAKRNTLQGPGTWGVNLGVSKEVKLSERVVFKLGVDINNLFNHRLLMPTQDDGVYMAQLGNFNLGVDANKNLYVHDFTVNPDFGRLINVENQEGVDGRRTIRFRLRITF